MSLSTIIQDAQSQALKEFGAFYAFSSAQLAEQAVKDVEYVNMGVGLICPKANAKALEDRLDTIYKKGIQTDLELNGKEKIIRRELFNHECFYTGDITDCVYKLADYPITEAEIFEAYNHIRSTEDVDC